MAFHADLDGGAVIPPENIKAVCSELKYNPKTRLLRYCAPKTKLEHKANRKKFPDYTQYETEKAQELADSANYEFKTDEPYSSEYQTTASSEEESYESESATAEEESDSDGSSSEKSDSGGRKVRFSERRYPDREDKIVRAGTPAPQRQSEEKDDSPDRIRATSNSGRNRKSEKIEKTNTADKYSKRDKRSVNKSAVVATAAASDDDDDIDVVDEEFAPEEAAAKESFGGSVDKRSVPRVCIKKSRTRSRAKHTNNSSASANKREKRTKICNPFTRRSKSTKRHDVKRVFGARAIDYSVSNAAAAAAAQYGAAGTSGGGNSDGDRPVRKRGRVIDEGIVPPDVPKSRRRARKRKPAQQQRNGAAAHDDDDDNDTWAIGKPIPADAVYW